MTTSPAYRKPEAVIGDLIRAYEALHPGQKPTLKWLMAHSRLSMGCVGAHRQAYYRSQQRRPE